MASELHKRRGNFQNEHDDKNNEAHEMQTHGDSENMHIQWNEEKQSKSSKGMFGYLLFETKFSLAEVLFIPSLLLNLVLVYSIWTNESFSISVQYGTRFDGVNTRPEDITKNVEQIVEDVNCIVRKGTWSPCSQDCGGGTKTKTDEIIQNAEGNGEQCPQILEESKTCNEMPCKTLQNLVMSEFGAEDHISLLDSYFNSILTKEGKPSNIYNHIHHDNLVAIIPFGVNSRRKHVWSNLIDYVEKQKDPQIIVISLVHGEQGGKYGYPKQVEKIEFPEELTKKGLKDIVTIQVRTHQRRVEIAPGIATNNQEAKKFMKMLEKYVS